MNLKHKTLEFYDIYLSKLHKYFLLIFFNLERHRYSQDFKSIYVKTVLNVC